MYILFYTEIRVYVVWNCADIVPLMEYVVQRRATSRSCWLISMQWCNGNVVLRVELPSGCPVHDGMQSPAQSSMSVYDLMPVK